MPTSLISSIGTETKTFLLRITLWNITPRLLFKQKMVMTFHSWWSIKASGLLKSNYHLHFCGLSHSSSWLFQTCFFPVAQKYNWTSFVVKYCLDCRVPLGASERKRKTVSEFRIRKRGTETEGRYQSLQYCNCCCNCPDKARQLEASLSPRLDGQAREEAAACLKNSWVCVPQCSQGSPQCLCSYFR